MKDLRYFVGCILISLSTLVGAQNYQGELEIIIMDDFDKDKAQTGIYLKSGEDRFTLELPDTIDKNSFATGDTVVIEGDEMPGETKEKKIVVKSMTKKK